MRDGQSDVESLDCLGWRYFVQFDVFHQLDHMSDAPWSRRSACRRTTRPPLIVRGGGSASRRIPGHRAARRA